MMMYHVSEEYILTTWSIETLAKKTRNGINFLLMQKGIFLNKKEKKEDTFSEMEMLEMYRNY